VFTEDQETFQVQVVVYSAEHVDVVAPRPSSPTRTNTGRGPASRRSSPDKGARTVTTRRHSAFRRAAGFTMIELLIGSAIMLIAVLGALFIYSRSNKVSVEQQMVTEVQNDVRRRCS